MIYFVQTPSGSIKIGYSSNVHARIEALESHYGKSLSLLRTMPGDRSKEQEIHRRFSHLRLGKTEQFRPEPDLMEFMGKPVLVGMNPQVIEAVRPNSVFKSLRLDLGPADHARLERVARARGLAMTSYVRMILLERLEADEARA